MPRWTGTSGSRLLVSPMSAPQGRHDPEEDPLPLVPRQQPIHQPVPPANDLARHLDDRMNEPLELHAQQPTLLLPVAFLVAGGGGGLQRGPPPPGSRRAPPHPLNPAAPASSFVERRPPPGGVRQGGAPGYRP